MKRLPFRPIVPGLILAALAMASCSRNDPVGYTPPPDTSPDTLWTRTFGGASASDVGNCLRKTSGGGYIIGGWTGSYGGSNQSAWLIKTDSSGQQEWANTYGGADQSWVQSLQQTSDQGFVFVGTLRSGLNSMIWMVKTNSVGTLEWSKTFSREQQNWGYGIHQTQDGGFVLTGSIYGTLTDQKRIWIIKTDGNGDSLWTRVYGDSTAWMAAAQGIDETSDGGIVFTGTVWPATSEGSALLLMKINATGDSLRWSKQFALKTHTSGITLQYTADNGIIVLGNANTNSQDYTIYLLKTSGLGIEQWHDLFSGFAGDVQQTADGGYIMIGSGIQGLYLARTDATGGIVWAKVMSNGTNSDSGKGIQPADSGGYVFMADTQAQNISDIWLVRLSGE